MKFIELGVLPAVCDYLEKQKITSPTPVQEKAIPIALGDKDIVVTAKTGTGKTLAYLLPIVQRLHAEKDSMALVLVPTRELATQVQSVLSSLLNSLKMPPACVLIGGVSFRPQLDALRKKPKIIVATPGRLLDHLRNSKLNLSTVKFLVLDEADRMLDMGFLPQVKDIEKHLTDDKQIFLFTATLPNELGKLLNQMLKDPERIYVDPPSEMNGNIEQKSIKVSNDMKQETLLDAIKTEENSILVFARTKRRTDRLAMFLEQYGVRAERIHGDRSQAQRQKAIDSFRRKKVRILVATDIAARGLDIPSVDLVVNFDLPEAKEDYIHRIGRTGRAGAKGVALSIVSPDENYLWSRISGEKSEGGDAGAPPRRRSRGGRGGSRDKGGFSGGRGRDRRPSFDRKESRGFRAKREDSRPREDREPRGFRPDREESSPREYQGNFDKPMKRGNKVRFGQPREANVDREKKGFGRREPRGNKGDFASKDKFSRRERSDGNDRGDRSDRGDRPRSASFKGRKFSGDKKRGQGSSFNSSPRSKFSRGERPVRKNRFSSVEAAQF